MAMPLKGDAPRDTRMSLTAPKRLVEGIYSIAGILNKSANDIMVELMEDAVSRYKDDIERFEKFRREMQADMKNRTTERKE